MWCERAHLRVCMYLGAWAIRGVCMRVVSGECMHAHVCTRMCTCARTRVYVRVCVRVCAHVCVCVRAQARVCVCSCRALPPHFLCVWPVTSPVPLSSAVFSCPEVSARVGVSRGCRLRAAL